MLEDPAKSTGQALLRASFLIGPEATVRRVMQKILEPQMS